MTTPQHTLTLAAGCVAGAAAMMVALYWHEWGAQLTGVMLVCLVVVGIILVIVANVQRWQDRDACRAVKPPAYSHDYSYPVIPPPAVDVAAARQAAMHHALQATRAAVRAGWPAHVVAQATLDACHQTAEQLEAERAAAEQARA